MWQNRLYEKVGRGMTAALIFLFLVLPIADVVLWSIWQSSQGRRRQVLTFSLAVVALPQAVLLAFVAVRVISVLLKGVNA
jgi:ABC-type spermidine/putrescine transport system permease subunit II